MAAANQILGGKYRLDRLLGSGGFASVWEARHTQLDRPVAIKVLSDALAHKPDFRERFLREARLASRPIHETICRVEDVGATEEGIPYLVMEFLTGRTLSEELSSRGALPLEEAAEIGRLALAGLAAAHSRGIVHRDIKPANLFLCTMGTPGPALRILDFGLAKDLGEGEGVTTTEQWMGTPDFFPPEYFGGKWKSYGPEGDVFSIGVVLFNALTGRRPLDGILPKGTKRTAFFERASYYAAHGALPSPADVAPDVPPELDAIVARAISLDPSRRFPDAGAMLAAWESAIVRLQAGGLLPALDPSSSRPPAALLGLSRAGPGPAPARAEPSWASLPAPEPSATGTGGSWVMPAPRPRRLWIALGAALVLVLGTGIGIGILLLSRALGPDADAASPPPGAGVPVETGPAAPDLDPGGGLDFTIEEGPEADAGPALAGTDGGAGEEPAAAPGPGPRPRGKVGRRRPDDSSPWPAKRRGGGRGATGGDDYGGVPFDQMGRGR